MIVWKWQAFIGGHQYGKILDLLRVDLIKWLDGHKIQMLEDHVIIVSGGAKGIDYTAQVHGTNLGIPTLTFPALWDDRGRGAGMKRNEYIAQFATNKETGGGARAWWDGESPGTRDTMAMVLKAGFPVWWHTLSHTIVSVHEQDSLTEKIIHDAAERRKYGRSYSPAKIEAPTTPLS
jgi:hypothetical protein